MDQMHSERSKTQMILCAFVVFAFLYTYLQLSLQHNLKKKYQNIMKHFPEEQLLMANKLRKKKKKNKIIMQG